MRKVFLLPFIVLLIFVSFTANAQFWKWARTDSGAVQAEGCFANTDRQGNLYITGVSEGPGPVMTKQD